MIDTESDAGSWRRDWDSRAHTSLEYQQRIRELTADLVAANDRADKLRIAMLNAMALCRWQDRNLHLAEQVYKLLSEALDRD